MLLERILTNHSVGPITARQSTVSFFAARVCPNIPLVKAPPINTDIFVRLDHNHRSLLAPCPRRLGLDIEWYVEGCSGGPCRLRGGPLRLVRQRCLES